jgi:tetratricopeptide (TPR) repeat protein/CHAT domain-containing protein
VPTLLLGSLLAAAGLVLQATPQSPEDPSVRAAVERYYKTLEAEDIAAYLALWSTTAERPRPDSVKFLFEFSDDRYYDIEIVRSVLVDDRLRVRVSLRRERTRPPREPGGQPSVTTTTDRVALTFVREAGDWKLVSEGFPSDDLAASIAAAPTPAAREALLAAEPDLLNTALVVSLLRLGTNASVQRQYPRAETIFALAVDLAKRTGSSKQEGESLQNLGNTLYFQRRFPDALNAYEQRLALEEKRADDGAAAMALSGIATIKYSLADYTEALRRYRQALAIQERLDDRAWVATTLISTGNVRYLQGDYSSAIRDYSRSRALFRSFGDTSGDARALEGLGRTYLAQGDFAAALSAFAGVLAEGRARGDRERQATAMQSIADVHLRLGNIDAARKGYEESRDHFMAIGNVPSAARVWQGLGMTELNAGRVEQAEQAYRRSVTMCSGIKDEECVAYATVGLAFAQSAQEKYAEAIVSYRKGIHAFVGFGAREPAARAEVGLSQALTGANDTAGAMSAAARARQTAIDLSNDDVLWRAWTAEARALRKSGATDKAARSAVSATEVVERMRAAAAARPATAIPPDASAAFATLALLQAESSDPSGAWTSISRMRAIDLRTALAVNEREISRGMTAEEREQERVAAVELLSLFAQAARERALPKPDKARLAALDARISESGASRDTWMAGLYARLPQLRVWRGLAPLPNVKDPAPLLAPGVVTLDFVVDDDDALVVVASGGPEGKLAAYPIAIRRRALAERVNALLHAPILRDVAEWRKAALGVARLLPPDVMTLLASATRVVVAPDDVLWRVPFEALPIGDGYLGDRAQVSYMGSAAAAAQATGIDAAPVTTALGIAAPELASATTERLQQTAPGWLLRSAEAAVKEAASALDGYGEDGITLTGAAATEAAFRAKAPAASALHMGAPFRINGASPLFSPLLLSGDPASASDEDDGALEAREVMNLSLRARVAVLSDGAATSMRDGAAAADVLQWAWLAAGVPAVVVARWTSDPAASHALLAELHRRLREGSDPAAALHAARGAMRASPEWSAPFYWAGWIALGR